MYLSALGITLRLKERERHRAFQAMNMLFEIDHTPVRWELVYERPSPRGSASRAGG